MKRNGKTTAGKNIRGNFQVETRFEIDGQPNMQLVVTTVKYYSGFATTISKVKCSGNIESFTFGDLNQTLARYPEVKRGTPKILTELHNKALENISEESWINFENA